MLKEYTVTRSSVYRVYLIPFYIWSSIPYKIWFSFIKLRISYLINLKICIILIIIYESVARSTVYKSKIFILFIVEFQKVYPIKYAYSSLYSTSNTQSNLKISSIYIRPYYIQISAWSLHKQRSYSIKNWNNLEQILSFIAIMCNVRGMCVCVSIYNTNQTFISSFSLLLSYCC